ncbi:MAG: hypothetical protein ACI9UK_001161 [Candidatus Krumholzibacteriia bacterium]|jgi:hypothetical protein
MVTIESDDQLNLTMFSCTGTPTPSELKNTLTAFYESEPTLNTIWDFSNADLAEITAEKISELAAYLKNASHSRAGGRSALIYSMKQLSEMSERLSNLAELEIEDATIKVFDTMDKARHWISE